MRAWGAVAQRRFTDIEVEDLAMGCVETDTGCLLSVTSTAAATPERAVTIEVYGSRATAVWTGPSRPRLRVYGSRAGRRPPPVRQRTHARTVRGVHPVARSLEAFRRWVTLDEEPLNTAESTLPVLAAVTSIYAAARAGRTFDIPALPAPGGRDEAAHHQDARGGPAKPARPLPPRPRPAWASVPRSATASATSSAAAPSSS